MSSRLTPALPRAAVGLAALVSLVAAVAVLPPNTGRAATAAPASPPPTKLITIVEENRTAASALRGMPYLASMAATYGRATGYRGVSHPSLPNYLALAGGSTFGVADDSGPAAHRLHGPSVFDQVLAHGRTAKTYAEGMPGPCWLGYSGSAPRYAVKHNPWAYFADPVSRANCRHLDLPLGTTSAGPFVHDINAGTLPTVGLVVPDTCNDGHDCPSATADTWLRTWLPRLMAGPDYRTGRLAIVVTFDEDDTSGDNTVLTTVIAPSVHGVVTALALDHLSWTRWADELAHSYLLRGSARGPSLRTAFGL